MATDSPFGNTSAHPRARKRKWLIVAFAILGGILVVWLVAVGFFRQSRPQTAVRRLLPQPPAALNTAADYLTSGDYYFELGDYDRAIAEYSRAIELKPDFAEAYNNRAYTQMKQEHYAAALPDLERAIELRPDYINAYINQADIYNYYYQIDRDRAISIYDRVLQLDPENVLAHGHRSIALLHEGDLGGFLADTASALRQGLSHEAPSQ